MSLRCLRIPAILILALPVWAQTDSLGDFARQLRSERQQSGACHPKVYTNEDLAKLSGKAAAEKSTKDGDERAPAEPSEGAASADKQAAAEATNSGKQLGKEAAIQERTEEINQRYLQKIADLRTQISTAQKELARLQRDQAESTNQFRNSAGTAPSVPEYQEQQTVLNQQIEAQRNLIVSLTSQLEDAQESARHAGVPHADE